MKRLSYALRKANEEKIRLLMREERCKLHEERNRLHEERNRLHEERVIGMKKEKTEGSTFRRAVDEVGDSTLMRAHSVAIGIVALYGVAAAVGAASFAGVCGLAPRYLGPKMRGVPAPPKTEVERQSKWFVESASSP